MNTINPSKKGTECNLFDPYGLIHTKQIITALGIQRLTVNRFQHRGVLTRLYIPDLEKIFYVKVSAAVDVHNLYLATTNPTTIPTYISTSAIIELCQIPRHYSHGNTHYFSALELYYLFNRNQWPISKQLTGSAAAFVFLFGERDDKSVVCKYGTSHVLSCADDRIATQADILKKLAAFNELRPKDYGRFSRGNLESFGKYFEH